MDEKSLNDIELNTINTNENYKSEDVVSPKNDNNNIIISNQNEDNILSEDDGFEVVDKSIELFSDSSEIFQDSDYFERSMIKTRRKIILYNIKDHLMMFTLLLSSSLNFSYLYILTFFIGLYYINLLFKNSKDKKKEKLKIELIVLIYSSLLLITKLIIIGLIDNDHLDGDNQIVSLYNTGIRYTKNNSNFYDVFITFLGEGLLFFSSIFSIVISLIFKKIDMENDEILPDKKKLLIKFKILMFFIYFIILSFATFNTSFLTLMYLFVYQVMLLVVIIKNDIEIYIKLYTIISYFFLICISIQLSLINIFNIYQLQQKYLMTNKIPTDSDENNFDKVYSNLTKFGVNCSYHYLPLRIFYEWLGYFSAVCIIIIFSSSIKIINECKSLETLNNMEDENNDESRNKKEKTMGKMRKFFKNILEKIKIIFKRPKLYIDLCRILSIFWIYKMENYYSVGIFIFVFCSFIYNNIIYYILLISFILIPFTCISIGCLHVSNINGYLENIPENEKEFYKHFGLEKLDQGKMKYFVIGMYYFFIMLFVNSISYSTSSNLNEGFLSSRKKDKIENLKEPNEEMKVPLLSKENINNKENNLINNDENDFTFIDIILKIVLKNIDKITLLVMYLIAIHTVNLVHLIFIIIFMTLILSPNTIKKYNTVVIIIIQVLFLIEYLVELTKSYYLNFFESNIDTLKSLISIDKEKKEINIYIEILCYFAVYCFYEQKIILNSEKFEKLKKNHNISLKNYINIKFKKMHFVRITLFTIFYSVLEFYAWIIISLFFYISYFLEVNILFAGKLALFFIVIYNFVIKIQIMKKNQKISLRVNKLLIAYCCFNTFIVYVYQLICADSFRIYYYITISENFFIQNLPTFGLVHYEVELIYKLLPHFLSIFLSIILYYEMKAIYSKVNDDDNNIFDTIEKSENDSKNLSNIEEKKQIKINEDNNNCENDNIENANIKEENKIEKENENQIMEEEIDEEENLIIKYMNIRDKIDNLNKKYIINGVIIFFLNIYRPFLFILICYIFITYNFSIAMIIYFLIFGITYIFMFNSLLKNTCHYNYGYYHPFFFTQYIRYKSIEKKKHKSISNKYKYVIFKLMIIFSLFFLSMTYVYILFISLKQNCNDNTGKCGDIKNRLIEQTIEYGRYIKAIVYLFGIYVNYEDIRITKSSWQFFLFLFLSCIDIYIQKLLIFISKKNEKNRDEQKDLLRQKLHIKYLIKFGKHQAINYNFLNRNAWKNKDNIKKDFEKYFLSIFENSKNIEEILPKYTSRRRIIITMRFIKKIYEYFIITTLISIAILKTNIWSCFYLIIAIILLVQPKLIKKFNLLFIIIILSILIQSLIFVSNISEENYPNFSENEINSTLHLPWNNRVCNNNDRYIFILGLGNKRSQIKLLSCEYVFVIIIYIYLFYFCFTIYNSEYVKSKYWYSKNRNIIYSLLFDSDLRDIINHMNKQKYNNIADCMYNNFNIKITLFQKVRNTILQLNDNMEENKENTTKEFDVSLHQYILYLFFHNFVLIMILMISMMVYGFISVVYISFCLYFLYKSKAINKGKKYNYPFLIKVVLLTIMICDIFLQTIIQIPYILLPTNSSKIYSKIMSGVGLIQIINNNENNDNNYELSSEVFLLLGKCVCIFCIFLQGIIYSSKYFLKFYLSYLIVKDEKFKISSIINSFQFNNERIRIREKSLLLKKDMENSMNILQKDLEEWNKKLFSENYNKETPTPNDNVKEVEFNQSNDKLELVISVNEKEYADENVVKKIVKKWILKYNIFIKVHIFLNKISFSYKMAINKKEGEIFILNCIQGKTEKKPFLEKIIDEQISTLDLSKFYLKELKDLKKFLKNDCKDNKKLNENLNDNKYKQFTKFKTSKLFTKYLRNTYLISKIIRDCLLIISNKFNWVCYFIMILNHILNASLISLFYPISIFCYAILEYQRPSKKYWTLCLNYTYIMLIIKCSLQKQFIGKIFEKPESEKNESSEQSIYDSLNNFLNQYPVGIKIFENNKIYFFYIFLDFSLISAILINVHFLTINGLWEKKEQYIENIYEALERIALYKDQKFDKIDDIKSFNKIFLSNKMTNNKYLRRGKVKISVNESNNKKLYNSDLSNNKNKKYDENNKNYFQKIFTRIRNEKPGRDFYYFYSLAMIIIIFYLLIFYTTMIQDKTYGAVNIKTNQFSGMSIILVLLHLAILIYDRVIYLRQNKNEVKIDYLFFDKEHHKIIEEKEFLEIKNEIIDSYPKSNINNNFIIPFECIENLSTKYNIINIQKENFNVPLLEKYIIYILLSILSHLFIFFYVTMQGNYNINNAIYCNKAQTEECNDFLENWSIIVFYLLYLFYLIFSGLQIKHNFYDFRRKSVFKNTKSVNSWIFDVYKLIPFYYPIKNVVDWTFTSTTFSLFEWFKFENLYDNIFKTYRNKRLSYNKPIGKKVKKFIKILIGGSASLVLISILIVPLILFSSLNPTNQLNNVTSAQTKIYLSFVDKNEQVKNILVFESDWAESIKLMKEDGGKTWEEFKYADSIYTETFPEDQIQVIKLYSQPENTLSSFKVSLLKTNIESLLHINDTSVNDTIESCNLIIETTFTRPLPNEAKSVIRTTKLEIYNNNTNLSLNSTNLENLYNYLNEEKNTSEVILNISNFSPYVRLTASDEAKILDSNNFNNSYNIYLKPSIENGAYLFNFYFLSEESERGIEYHVFNDKVSSSTSGYSVIGFYSAFILVIGTYITNFFDYKTEKIIINEMPHPEKLINLCECIKISRYTFDFKKEEYLFNILIEIMRTPEYVKKLTKSTLEQYESRKKIPQ